MRALLAERSVVVCCGPGGVGKTTASAAMALAAAKAGRRAVVVTVDPAQRLADALGLAGGLTNEPKRIEGLDVPGELWAVMLDAAETFDGVVAHHAGSPDQAERIIGNRFYRNISRRLSGTQEYMAAEKLYQLHGDERFDLVVVDTPPTRNALDVLDAPERLARFLDHRLYRTLVMPTSRYLKIVGAAAQLFLRSASKIVGASVVDDAITFFRAFDGMEAGFRQRSGDVLALFQSADTAFVAVTTPRADRVTETDWLVDRLGERGNELAALIVNQLHPAFSPVDGDSAAHRNLAELAALGRAEREAVAGLRGRVDSGAVVEVLASADDVHDLDGLAEVARQLVAG